MRELIGVLLAVLVVTAGIGAAQERIRDWARARSATAAGASMGLFLAAARDYLDGHYMILEGRVPAVGDVVHVTPGQLRSAGLLPQAWQDAGGSGGQHHVLAVRRSAADSLTALAYTYGGRPLDEHSLVLAARGAPPGLGILSAEFATEVVSITDDWRVQRSLYNTDPLYPIANSPAGDGRLAAVLFAHRGRILGPWLCRAEVPARPECNEMTAALKITPASLVAPDKAALEVSVTGGRALDVSGDARLDGDFGLRRDPIAGVALAVTGDSWLDGTLGVKGRPPTGTVFAVTGETRLDGATGIQRAPAAGASLAVAGDAAISGDLRVDATIRARNYVQTSDPRAKTGLAEVACTPALRARLERVRLHAWTWKQGGQPGLGYNAEEVALVLPQLVHVDAAGMKHVDYNALAVLKQECLRARPAHVCPAGRFRLTRWGPVPVILPARPAGHVIDRPGPARGFMECPYLQARCSDPADGAAAMPAPGDRHPPAMPPGVLPTVPPTSPPISPFTSLAGTTTAGATHGWHFSCAAAPGTTFRPEPAVTLTVEKE